LRNAKKPFKKNALKPIFFWIKNLFSSSSIELEDKKFKYSIIVTLKGKNDFTQ
jgi:hypothetical protein